MRKMFILSAIILLFAVYSCDKDQSSENFETANLERSTDPILGNYDGREFTFAISETILLENWNANLLHLEGIDAQLTLITFVIIDGSYYLRATGLEYTSTLMMDIGEGGNATAGISCTSKRCSDSSTACVPKKDKLSCTSCWSGDCTKTVTALTRVYDYD